MFFKTLLILLSILFLLLYLYSRQKAAESDASHPKAPRKRYPRWKWPKTDERINRMLAESIARAHEGTGRPYLGFHLPGGKADERTCILGMLLS